MGNFNLVWFRRDLRLEDNTALNYALNSNLPVICLFIFDKNILERLDNPEDRRVAFIHKAITEIHNQLNLKGSALLVKHGRPEDIFVEILTSYHLENVFVNDDYEPDAIKRDRAIELFLKTENVKFNRFKDQVIFEKKEIVKDNQQPYTVFTPYMRKWKEIFEKNGIPAVPTSNFQNLNKEEYTDIPTLKQLGFEHAVCDIGNPALNEEIIQDYHKTRDLPAIRGTSRISVHLRFGTISIRKLVNIALNHNETWLNELIWREFYMMILWNYPYVVEQSFKKKYDQIAWRNNEEEFKKWCEGVTGYPMVDAGMRELNETGFMHNRLRMITASFLTKHLLIDWRWGEQYFADQLLDFELSSNNGGWQWAASSGCDAVPYFRIFNPELQAKKFDPQEEYIKKWIPEFKTSEYAEPIVDHRLARERALATYKKALQ